MLHVNKIIVCTCRAESDPFESERYEKQWRQFAARFASFNRIHLYEIRRISLLHPAPFTLFFRFVALDVHESDEPAVDQLLTCQSNRKCNQSNPFIKVLPTPFLCFAGGGHL
jgi:hypothetical protein